MKASEIRKEARESLKNQWLNATCITLAYTAISFILSYVQKLLGEKSTISNILDLVYFIINIPLSFGLVITFMKLKRNENVSTFDFFKEGFSRFGKAWGITWHTFLKLLLPIIFMIIILVMLTYFSYMSFSNSLADISNNSILITVLNLFNNNVMLTLIFLILLFLITLVYMSIKYLLYVLTYYINYENPELSSKECVNKSAELMKGNRWKYFLLGLSFFGWAFLAALTNGIGMILLTPYMQVSTVCFYEKITKVETIKAKPTEKFEE